MINKLLIMATILLSATALQPALADDVSFHQQSKSYHVYLGIVPVGLLKESPGLVDNDKQLHGGTGQQLPGAQHVMVAIFRSNDNSRVINATVIAEIEQKQFFGGKDVSRPLEKMITDGTTAYANFFDMPKSGEYKIEIKIYESLKSGSEKVSFIYKKS